MLTSARVKELAREAGFDLCGIADPETIPEVRDRYYRWLHKNFHGEMEYLSRSPEVRTEPKRLMDRVGAIIMLGLNYYQPNSVDRPKGHGRVARYARGRDYHKVIVGMSKKLIRLIQEEISDQEGAEFKYYVDFGPVLERAYARKAGFGFIGKNSMLINREFGSWFFLSEIVTNLKLEYDQPVGDSYGSCGECTLCVDSCPTGAIVADGVIKATKCISYLTIEKPTDIPAPFGRMFGEQLFGCDICQEVCPFNEQAISTKTPDLQPERGVGEFVSVEKLLSMTTRDEYLKFAAGTPLMRPGLDNLKRNAEIVRQNLDSLDSGEDDA